MNMYIEVALDLRIPSLMHSKRHVVILRSLGPRGRRRGVSQDAQAGLKQQTVAGGRTIEARVMNRSQPGPEGTWRR